jgi:hypothetical protein
MYKNMPFHSDVKVRCRKDSDKMNLHRIFGDENVMENINLEEREGDGRMTLRWTLRK